jgi:mono/diheme cytochrome c family protein
MNRRAFFFFALFAVAFAVALPLWASGKVGDSDAPAAQVAAEDEQERDLFVTNCGACHTLAAAGTDGVVGPDLDHLLGVIPNQKERVLAAIEHGVEGRMPAGILQGGQADQVADFVSRVAGQ